MMPLFPVVPCSYSQGWGRRAEQPGGRRGGGEERSGRDGGGDGEMGGGEESELER